MTICVSQIVIALLAFPFVIQAVEPSLIPRRLLLLTHVLVYGGAGLTLYFGSHRENRARLLGAILLLTASVFAASAIFNPVNLRPTLLIPLVAVFSLRADAFTPLVVWMFVREFPRVPESRRGRAWLDVACFVSAALSCALIVGNLAIFRYGTAGPVLGILARTSSRSLYFQSQYLLIAIAFVVLLHRTRRAPVDERKRVSLLLWGIVGGATPSIIWIALWTLVPGFDRLLPLSMAGWIIYPSLLAVPLIAAYAVLMRHALGVAVVLRRFLEHALGQYAVSVMVLVPAVFLLAQLYARRAERLDGLISSWDGVLLLGLFGASAAALVKRATLRVQIDRFFFRERYDARHVIATVVDECRWAATREDLAGAVRTGIDRALHVVNVGVLLTLDEAAGVADPQGRLPSLTGDSPLLASVRAASRGLLVEKSLGEGTDVYARDRAWIDGTDSRLLFPLLDANTRLVGLVCLGEKRSALPYTESDRELVGAVCEAAELALAYHRLSAHSPPNEAASIPPLEALASECVDCGLIGEATAGVRCVCGGQLAPALLPRVLMGKWHLAARVGAGGHGSVYRAMDQTLARAVALKTLPYHSPDEARRLRQEAQAMAAVSHPNIAAIYSVESWNGRPILVCEFLAGGTLGDRLREGPIPVDQALALGAKVASGLLAVHRAGLLHGDIKPSNLGFSATGEPKLLDFGVARRTPTGTDVAEERGGTLTYMAPEVACGGRLTLDADVWSLALTLYEAIAGIQPMLGDDFLMTRRRVLAGLVPPLSKVAVHVPADVSAVFDGVLTPNASRSLAAFVRNLERASRGASTAS